MFQGVIVKISVTETATAVINKNFSCGVFLFVVCCIFPQPYLHFI
jgi:hypothetical protein